MSIDSINSSEVQHYCADFRLGIHRIPQDHSFPANNSSVQTKDGDVPSFLYVYFQHVSSFSQDKASVRNRSGSDGSAETFVLIGKVTESVSDPKSRSDPFTQLIEGELKLGARAPSPALSAKREHHRPEENAVENDRSYVNGLAGCSWNWFALRAQCGRGRPRSQYWLPSADFLGKAAPRSDTAERANARVNPRPHPTGTRSRVRYSNSGSTARRGPSFRSSLLDILPHRGNVTGRLLLRPNLEALGSLFQIPE